MEAKYLSLSPPRGYPFGMSRVHASHPDVITRLKRAEGHLSHVITTNKGREPCLNTARQFATVESAVTAAKRVLISHHIDHCLDQASNDILAEMKGFSKLL